MLSIAGKDHCSQSEDALYEEPRWGKQGMALNMEANQDQDDMHLSTTDENFAVAHFPDVQSFYEPMRTISAVAPRRTPKVYYVRFWFSITIQVLREYSSYSRK